MDTASSYLSASSEPTPVEWLRVKEACHYSRISKATLYALLNRGLIRSVSLRERGQIKGTRLISFDSLKHFLDSRATGGLA
jgi:excisionase family DNA binding protein